jgi:cell wall-associated NlpC family hydrolase
MLKAFAFSLLLQNPIGMSAQTDTIASVSNPVADSVVAYAHTFLGTPYVWAGCSPKGFDCSGFVHYVYAHFGYRIERSSSGLANAGRFVAFKDSRKGDLILFRGTNPKDKTVGHVGIIISPTADSLQFIHASSSKKHWGVVVTDYFNSNYPDRFVSVRRLLP